MKICVYGICKNEEKFVDRCIDSVKEADLVVMCDTGSTDSTVEKLKAKGVIVHQVNIDPWRFDKARNICLDLIPEDIDVCVSIDLDEMFTLNWREEIEKVWKENTTCLNYPYVWSFDENGKPCVTFYYNKIHTRKGYRWIYPIHEVLDYVGKGTEQVVKTDRIVLNHFPDNSKPRNYLPILEIAVKENPTDTRCTHYLGREYFYYQEWEKCIETLKTYLKMPNATWKEERAFSGRYIAASYKALEMYDLAKSYLISAIAEAPHLREPYVELGLIAYETKDWSLVIWALDKTLNIKEKNLDYHNEAFAWNHSIFDVGAIATYYMGDYQRSLNLINAAIELAPSSEQGRLLANKELICASI